MSWHFRRQSHDYHIFLILILNHCIILLLFLLLPSSQLLSPYSSFQTRNFIFYRLWKIKNQETDRKPNQENQPIRNQEKDRKPRKILHNRTLYTTALNNYSLLYTTLRFWGLIYSIFPHYIFLCTAAISENKKDIFHHFCFIYHSSNNFPCWHCDKFCTTSSTELGSLTQCSMKIPKQRETLCSKLMFTMK